MANNDGHNVNSGDLISNTIGKFGKWQLRVALLMAFLKLPISWIQIGGVIFAPPTNFYCQKPDVLKNVTDVEWRNLYFDVDNSSSDLKNPTYTYCTTPVNLSSVLTNIEDNLNSTGLENSVCGFGYFYDDTLFTSSIITEWDLVCDKNYLIGLSQVILMLGVLIGNVVFGIAADKYGRKTYLTISVMIQFIFSILMAFAPTYWTFTLCRFIVGIANGGLAIISFVICMEAVSGKYRTIVPILYQIPFGVASSLLALLSYLIKDWRTLQLTLSVFYGVFLLYHWLVNESPLWLMAVGKKDECREILKSAARVNKIDVAKVDEYFENDNDTVDVSSDKGKLGNIFRYPKLLKRTIVLSINWFICGISMFAFSLHLGYVGSDFRMTVISGGLGVIPGALLCAYVAKRFGRRKSIIVSNLASSVCMLALAFTPKEQNNVRVALIVVNVIMIAVYTPGMYVYTGELFPTVIRNAGLGLTAMFSRIGSILAPLLLSALSSTDNRDDESLITHTSKLVHENEIEVSLVLIVLSVFALAQAILILPLPETRGLKLKHTLDEEDERYSNNNIDNKYVPVPTTNLNRL